MGCHPIHLQLLMILWAIAFFSHQALAQNMGMVFSPVVKKGVSTVDYRFGYQNEGGTMAQRLQYKYGISDSWDARALIQFNQSDNESLGFQYVRFESMWQFLEEETAGWASAARFGVEIPDNSNTPYRVGLSWSGLVNLDDYWQLRGNLLIKREFGPNRESGFFPGGRLEISRIITEHVTLALDYFGGHNNITTIGNFDANAHQLGPLFVVRPFKEFTIKAGVLYGISASSPGLSVRVNFGYQF